MVPDRVLPPGWPEAGYIDIHCHRYKEGCQLEVLSLDSHDFIAPDLAKGFYTLGMHPWFIQLQDRQAAWAKIAAAASDSNMLAIGECGLDKAITTDFSLQMEVFNRQIEMAEQFSKPLMIHCVRAFNELLHCKKIAKSGLPWIIHGFKGKPELAGQLLQQGFYLSFGKALLDDGYDCRPVLANMPVERLFLETDAADISITRIYAAAARYLGLEVPALQQQIIGNFKRVFHL